MKVSLRVPPCRRTDEVAAVVVEAEAAGVWATYFPDSQLLWRDVFATMALCGDRTSRIGLATGVTNLVTRHPTVIASAIRTIQETAGDRVRLGLGAGSSSVRPLGLELASSRAIEQAVAQIRALTSGSVAAIGERRVQLRDPAGRVPILLAATGPRRLELAGRIGDGVIVHSGTTPASLATALAAVERGAEASGRSLGDLQVIVTGVILVTDDLARDARLLKPICCTVAQDGGVEALRAGGIAVRDVAASGDSSAAPTPAAADDEATVYPDLKHAGDWGQAVAACDDRVSDIDAMTFAQRFCFAGTESEIAAQIEALQAVGVTEVLLQGLSSYDLPASLLRSVGSLARRVQGIDRRVDPAAEARSRE